MFTKKIRLSKIKVLLMLLPVFSFARQFISGRVISKSDLQGIAGVTVTVKSTG